jgi:hypothetical protein
MSIVSNFNPYSICQKFIEPPKYIKPLENSLSVLLLLYLQKQNDKTDMAKSIGTMLQLFFEKDKKSPAKLFVPAFQYLQQSLPSSPIVDILWRLHIYVVTSFICYKYIMSRDSALFYQALRRIAIKYRWGINGILHEVTFNITLPHLIPPSSAYSCHLMKRIFYKMACHGILRSCRKRMYVLNSVYTEVQHANINWKKYCSEQNYWNKLP